MKTGLTISIVGHAVLLLWGIVSFSARPLEARPTDSLPVDLITAKEFSELTAGTKNAPKAEQPKPLVEKVDEPKPVKDPVAKVVDKPEIQAAKEEPPAPPQPPEKITEPKPEKQSEPKVAEPKPDKKQPEPKVDPIAEALKKEEAKKLADAKTKVPMPARKPAPPQPKFDPDQVAALLDKRTPQRLAATGNQLHSGPMLGTTTGNAARLSQSEIDALRARLMSLWNPPAGARTPEELLVRIRIQLGRDGKLSVPPMVLTSGSSPLFEAARESAVRAVFRGQPFDMLSPDTYEAWRDIEITFDPREMFRG